MLIGTKSTAFGMSCQPNSVGSMDYRIRMPDKDLKKTLWDTVEILMKKKYGRINEARLSADSGIAPTNMTRYKQAGTNMGIDKVGLLAQAFDLEPWQLLIDGWAPGQPPALSSRQNSWPFEEVDPGRFYALDDLQRAKIEGAVLNMLSQYENASQSSPETGKVKTPIDRSGLRSGTPKRVQTTPQDLKSLRETKLDVSINRLSGKGNAGHGVNKKA